jgi:hypothetical protein
MAPEKVRVGQRVMSNSIWMSHYHRSGTVVKVERERDIALVEVKWDNGTTNWPFNFSIEEHP